MIFIYILLGIIQGITEPIPVSSSGHLVIIKNIIENDALNDLNFEIFVNFGSLIAIMIFFKKDLIALINDFFMYIKTKEKRYFSNFKYCLLIIVATIPAGIAGFILKDIIEGALVNVKIVGFSLLITALFLYLIKDLKGYKDDSKITIIDAIKIGLFQVIALFPGISRSGATLVGGMFSNLKRDAAFKFSFMLYIPISFATMMLGISDLSNSNPDSIVWLYYLVGMFFSAVITYFSTKWFNGIMKTGKLIYFVYYCIIVGTLVILFL